MTGFGATVSFGLGSSGKWCFDTFSWNTRNRVITIDRIVINQVEVSSCGMSLRRGWAPSL